MPTVAERPCILPWGVTFDFNDFKFCSLRGGLNRNDTLQRVYVKLKNGDTLYSPYYTEEQAWEVYNQVLLAIASSQSPWLKVEGYEFVDNAVYELLINNGSCYGRFLDFTKQDKDAVIGFKPCFDSGYNFNQHKTVIKGEGLNAQLKFVPLKDVLAFKPISDSQAVWKQYENVEVYKEKSQCQQ